MKTKGSKDNPPNANQYQSKNAIINRLSDSPKSFTKTFSPSPSPSPSDKGIFLDSSTSKSTLSSITTIGFSDRNMLFQLLRNGLEFVKHGTLTSINLFLFSYFVVFYC